MARIFGEGTKHRFQSHGRGLMYFQIFHLLVIIMLPAYNSRVIDSVFRVNLLPQWCQRFFSDTLRSCVQRLNPTYIKGPHLDATRIGIMTTINLHTTPQQSYHMPTSHSWGIQTDTIYHPRNKITKAKLRREFERPSNEANTRLWPQMWACACRFYNLWTGAFGERHL